MKGMELPVNTLIIVVIALVILLAILALFFGVWPSVQGVSLEAAKNNACQILTSTGCTADPITIKVNDFDADKDGNYGTAETGTTWTWGNSCDPSRAADGDNLAALCACYYFITTDALCTSDVCGCP
jgi:uncharacterized membrane protein